jgi:hypothetical protein
MRYFLQYHNCDKLGWVPLDEEPFLEKHLAIYTRKPLVKKAVGATVFVVASFGKPKRYYLWECFRVEKVETEGQEFCAWGTGWQLAPPQRLQGEAFEEFRKACAWFIGFRGIDGLPYRSTLIDLADRHRAERITPELDRFCTKIVEHMPGSGDAWYFRGFVRSRLGRREEALADLTEAVRLGTEFLAEAESCRLALLAGPS